MVERGILPEKYISGWRCCCGEELPSEDTDQTVMFKSFYEKGFALLVGAFFRELLHFYGLEVTHLKPNSIAQIAIFIHLCEGYLGIAPHFKAGSVPPQGAPVQHSPERCGRSHLLAMTGEHLPPL